MRIQRIDFTMEEMGGQVQLSSKVEMRAMKGQKIFVMMKLFIQ
jgi:hypothetical protein